MTEHVLCENVRYVINGVTGVNDIMQCQAASGYYDRDDVFSASTPEVVYHLLTGGWMMVDNEIKPGVYEMNVYDKSGDLICAFTLDRADFEPDTFKEYE